MTPQQYERLTELFHAALEVAPDERAAFLKKVSDGDAELRCELESLLAAHEQGARTQKPPEDIAAGLFLAQQDKGAAGGGAREVALAPHTRIDRYEIRSLLGKGGMGEVYLAQDTTLRRLVALKLLPAAAAASEDRMRRFIQEAKAAAALSHPHIAQVFEIGRSDGVNFIAMEFVDGVTLRAKIHTEHTELRKLLKYLQQVAEGLAKAHAAGIVHRDLKPDNIMITRDGYAKILDFGLAKLIEPERPLGLDSATPSEVGTAIMAQQSLAGMVMGTAGYMSPEQAQGKVKEIDHRSDIFSFGCILFEAVTAHRPFAAESVIKSLHKVVYEAAPPIKDFNPTAPPDLQRIVRRCLAKDPDERYQTIKDVALELKEVRQGMAGAAELDTTVPPSVGTETSGQPPTGQSTTSTSSAAYLTSQIKSHKRSAATTLAVLVIAAAALAYFFYFKHKRAPALTEQDTILLADFVNTTGDAVLDGTLKTALAVQLEQSPFLNLFSDERVRETLRYMERKPDERVTKEVAREICERQGIKALLAGSVSNLGSHYVIALEATNAHTGDVLALVQEEAESKEQLLRTLGQAATRLREKLGESLNSIQKFDAPIEQTTTSSLEALKAYSTGRQLGLKRKFHEALPFLKRAVELDPNFASAYAGLANNSFNRGEKESGKQYATKAFQLRGHASEREKVGIEGAYYMFATGELEKAIEALELLKQTYPRDTAARVSLGFLNSELGNYEKSLEETMEALRLNPTWLNSNLNHASALIRLGRDDEAKEVLQRAQAQTLGPGSGFHQMLYGIAFRQGDVAAMQSELEHLRAGPDQDSFWFFWYSARTAEANGQLRKDREMTAHVAELSKQQNQRERAAEETARNATTNALYGHCELVGKDAAGALGIARTPESLRRTALTFALCGDLGQAQSLANESARLLPTDTLANTIRLPVIRAAMAIHNGNHAEAIVLLEAARRYDRADQFSAHYLRGLAYLWQRSGVQAGAEFQFILDHRGFDAFSPFYPLAQLGLARAAVLNLDTAKARKAYQDFFALWKDADADLPVLIEAKKEYEKLK